MRRPPAAVRHVTTHPVALAATVATAIWAAVLAAAATSFAGAVTAAGARATLASAPGRDILVTNPDAGPATGASGRQVATAIRRALPGLPITVLASTRSDELDLPRGGLGGSGGRHAQTEIVTLPELAAHATVTAGTWPAAGPGPVQVAIPGAAARLLRLAPGDLLTTRDSLTAAPVRVRVSGIFRPDDPGNPYWQLNPVGGAGVHRSGGFSVYGPLVASPAATAAIPAGSAAWLAVPDAGRLGGADLAALSHRLAAALGQGTDASGVAGLADASVATSLPALLSGLGTALVVARSQLVIGVLILMLTAGATLAVAARLLAIQRAPQIAMLAARGASRRQLAGRGVAESAVLAAPAAVLGPLVGGWLAQWPARLGPLAAGPLGTGPFRIAGHAPATAWLAAAAAAAGSAAIIALPWLRAPRSPLQQRLLAARQRPAVLVITAGGDLALVALAVLAGWQLASYQAPVSAGRDGALGVDPVLATAPVLALAAGTVVTLRLLPLASRLLDGAATRSRGLVIALASWQLSRRPLRQAGPALLMVLAVATTTLSLAGHASWQRSVADQAGFGTGADERITLPPAASLPLATVGDVTAARGVSASTPAVRALAFVGGRPVTLLALNARAAAGVIPLRAGLAGPSPAGPPPGGPPSGGPPAAGPAPDGPPSGLLAGLVPAGPAPGVPVPGRPRALAVTARLRGTGITKAALNLQLTDASGAAYRISAGTLPANGRARTLTVTIAPGGHASYPLRLDGFTLDYLMPLSGHRTAELRVGPVRPLATATGSVAGGRSHTPTSPPTRHFQTKTSRTAHPPQTAHPRDRAALGDGVPVTAPGAPLLTHLAPLGTIGVLHPPTLARAQAGPGEDVTVRFVSGAANDTGAPPQVPASLSVTSGPRLAAVPGLATTAFLSASGQRPGTTVGVSVDGTTVPVRLAASVSAFPTLGTGAGLVVDQGALQRVLDADGLSPVPVTEWWLRTTGTPAVSGLPAGTSVTRRATLASTLGAAPLSAAPQQAMLAIAAAAVLLALAGLMTGLAAARERARDMALLGALGTPPRRVAGLLCLAQVLLSAPAAAAGLLLGLLLSRLIVPAASLTPQAAHPVPPVLVEIPWLPVIAVAAGITAVSTLAAGVPALRPAPAAARLRVEEET
jgi:FtsX-like permease family protein